MSGMMLHGLGDCTPERNCGCMVKAAPADELRERIAQALYVEHSRRYGVALARWSECHPSYYADADAVIAALGLVDEECQCGADITHRDEHHRRSVCVRASGHSGAHDDGQGCVWTGGNQ